MLTEGAAQWLRAGMDGRVCGLDIQACLARLEPGIDRAAVTGLLMMVENKVVEKLNVKPEAD